MVRMGRRRLLGLGLASSIVGVGGLSYICNDVDKLSITRLKLGLNGKVAFLTDLHIHINTSYLENLAGIISSEEPDVILIAGDTIDEYTVDRAGVANFIKSLQAGEKYAVMGNHEYWAGQADWMARLLKANGYEVLVNSSAGSMLGRIVGLDWREDRLYDSIRAEGVVIVHDPNAANNISGECLILAGHTHGGLVLNGVTLYTNSNFVRGMYQLDGGTKLYVSRGLGQIFPLRINSRPELVIIE